MRREVWDASSMRCKRFTKNALESSSSSSSSTITRGTHSKEEEKAASATIHERKKKPVEESKDSFFQLFPPPSFSLHFPFSALRTLAHLPSSLLSTLFDYKTRSAYGVAESRFCSPTSKVHMTFESEVFPFLFFFEVEQLHSFSINHPIVSIDERKKKKRTHTKMSYRKKKKRSKTGLKGETNKPSHEL